MRNNTLLLKYLKELNTISQKSQRKYLLNKGKNNEKKSINNLFVNFH